MDTWRSDEKPEEKVYFVFCPSCHWESDESHGSEEECPYDKPCPECGCEVDVESEYV